MAAWQKAFQIGSCGECRQARRDLEMPPPECSACDRPVLLAANLPAWQLFLATAPLARDGMGGVRLDNFRLAAEAYDLDWDEVLLDKLSRLIQIYWQADED